VVVEGEAEAETKEEEEEEDVVVHLFFILWTPRPRCNEWRKCIHNKRSAEQKPSESCKLNSPCVIMQKLCLHLQCY